MRIALIRLITSVGPTAQPTRKPVAASDLLMPSTKMVYGAISGIIDTGFAWIAPWKVSIQ